MPEPQVGESPAVDADRAETRTAQMNPASLHTPDMQAPHASPAEMHAATARAEMHAAATVATAAAMAAMAGREDGA